jgi:transposase
MGRDARRARAAELFAEGASGAEVARRVGVSRATTTRWRRLFETGGRAALVATRRRGRPSRLLPAALARVDRALLRPPRDFGYDLDRWSLAAVAALIEKLTGERYHPPVGASADHAFRRRTLVDPEGNVVGLLARRRR